MAEDRKANGVGEKMLKRVEEHRDKCKEVMGEPSTEPFGTPRWICPRRTRDTTKLEEPWWNLACWNFGGTLVEPSAEPFGGPRRICPREPKRVRKQFYPETFTMAEDPKALLCNFFCISIPPSTPFPMYLKISELVHVLTCESGRSSTGRSAKSVSQCWRAVWAKQPLEFVHTVRC